MSAPESNYNMGQTQQLLANNNNTTTTQQQKPRQMSHVTTVSSHYGSPYQSPGTTAAYHVHPSVPQSRKRSFQEDTTSYTYDYPGLQQLQSHAEVPVELTPHGHHAQLQPGAALQYQPYTSQRPSPQHSHSGQSSSMHSQSLQQQQQQQQQQQHHHHHHRLPNQQPPSKLQRTTGSFSALSPTPEDDHGPPNVVGQPGMPAPAPRPKGPKLKFTPEDDALLIELKEAKNLTWKQIADFFPGRSSGTLQVRYCTKLKAKTMAWTGDMIQRLRQAISEYEADRWRIISSKVGNGFSAAACKDKALELVEEDEAELLQQQQEALEAASGTTATAGVRREEDLKGAF